MSIKEYSSTTSDEIVEDASVEHEDELDEARQISDKETVRVRMWRFINADVIIMIACTISLTGYGLLRDREMKSFEAAYEEHSSILEQSVVAGQTVKRKALRNFATTISSLAEATATAPNSTTTTAPWPFFQIPAFEAQADQVKDLSGLDQIIFAPRVQEQQQEEWISFIRAQGYQDDPNFHPYISAYFPETSQFLPDIEREYYFPTASWSPAATNTSELVTWNFASTNRNEESVDALLTLETESLYISPEITPFPDEPQGLTNIFSPVHLYASNENDKEDNTIVGLLSGGFSWEDEFQGILPEGANGMLVVIQSNCGDIYTFVIDGPNATFKGFGDLHEDMFEEYATEINLTSHQSPETTKVSGHCLYTMTIYPTRTLELAHRTWFPEISAVSLAVAFIIIAAAFFMYDILVDRRNEKLVDKFARSNAIVSSLFPRAYRDRLMGDADSQRNRKSSNNSGGVAREFSGGDDNFGGEGETGSKSKPLADIFPDASILFADIAGFTAWSSVREPSQVFTLLETLYGSFDDVAKRRGIFKVETVGDCYVAACGLPRPRRDHAVVMIRFANDIMTRMHVLTRELEVRLGPDTGDLRLRVGVNSGPVTAGILRGEKARFQIFGDVVNTASRAESLGLPGRIQITQSTADLIVASGHGHWLQKRTDMISAKGKGLMQTYFVTNVSGTRGSSGSVSSDSHSHNDSSEDTASRDKAIRRRQLKRNARGSRFSFVDDASDRSKRHVEWCVETLLQLIKQIVAHRDPRKIRKGEIVAVKTKKATGLFPLDEVKELITLPEFNRSPSLKDLMKTENEVEIPMIVVNQLRSFVSSIYENYNSNPFHNFEHANHVTMSVCKLLSRIVSPLEDLPEDMTGVLQAPDGSNVTAAKLHDHTYGITSDPLTQFACVFSALIHDADHPGVPNSQLVNENDPLAAKYKNRSVAEQHSLDLAWELFMDSSRADLRATICCSEAELSRFRQLVVNAVMATDIFDADLKKLRNDRWSKAFKNPDNLGDVNPRDAQNRKATIVIEHLMQASDVAHTMQHWHVYRSWNEKLFRENYKAFKEGRCATNPADEWYESEVRFFDYYIIPLARKLKECGVFGVSSDEYLDYAKSNRDEWVSRGREVVAAALKAAKDEFDDDEDEEVEEDLKGGEIANLL